MSSLALPIPTLPLSFPSWTLSEQPSLRSPCTQIWKTLRTCHQDATDCDQKEGSSKQESHDFHCHHNQASQWFHILLCTEKSPHNHTSQGHCQQRGQSGHFPRNQRSSSHCTGGSKKMSLGNPLANHQRRTRGCGSFRNQC